jgi:hypothetical protein
MYVLEPMDEHSVQTNHLVAPTLLRVPSRTGAYGALICFHPGGMTSFIPLNTSQHTPRQARPQSLSYSFLTKNRFKLTPDAGASGKEKYIEHPFLHVHDTLTGARHQYSKLHLFSPLPLMSHDLPY